MAKENKWKENLCTLFDIANFNANELITTEEDREFLRLQRKGRKGIMIGADKEDEKRQELAVKKQKSLEELLTCQSSSMDNTVFPEDSSGNTSSSCSETITSAEDIDINES